MKRFVKSRKHANKYFQIKQATAECSDELKDWQHWKFSEKIELEGYSSEQTSQQSYSSFFSISDLSGFSMISMSAAMPSDSASPCFNIDVVSSSITSKFFFVEISLSES